MLMRRTPSALVVDAPAKLNLHFEVLARRADGFHDVETVMVAIDLFDTLVFDQGEGECCDADGGGIRFEASWAVGLRAHSQLHETEREREAAMGDLPQGSDNLVVQAVELLARRSGKSLPHGTRIQLIKRIPAAAGLGGGSSDAAAALVATNELLGLGWHRTQLSEVAAELGSDVPFFLSSGAAICRGRGEQIEFLTGWPPLHFVVVRPPRGLETGAVYAGCMPPEKPVSPQPLLAALRLGDPFRVGRQLLNRLEESATRLMPAIGELKSQMSQLSFPGQQLTGSGSSYFAVCRNRAHARRAANQLRGCRLGHVFSAASINTAPLCTP